MSSNHAFRPVFNRAILYGAVTVWTVSAANSSAWATCGDYLQHSRYAVTTEAPSLPAAPLLPGPQTCTGPHCRPAPQAPAAPAAPMALRPHVDHVLCEREGCTPDRDAVRTCWTKEPDARPVAGALGEINHIPRSV